jgi:23S rRNA pseudouridine2605 synthase
MTHPKFQKRKVYEVELDSELAPLHQQMISDHGIALEDGVSQLSLERLSETDRRRWRVIMSEGRNRQIRRTFAALGYTVTALHRTQFGPYDIGDLAPGASAETTIR